MAKFISKSSNLLIVLSPGLAAQPLTGTPAKPTISVRFKDGVADVQQQELIDMMLAHPGFNGDFISADTVAVDPYANARKAAEPRHEMTEMKFGTPVSRVVTGSNVLPPEMQKLVQAAAVELAKAMLPSMVESTLKELVGARGAANTKVTSTKKAEKPKGKRGRPARVKIEKEIEKIEIQEAPAKPETPIIEEVVS